MTKAIATQVSGWANIRLSLQRSIDGAADGFAVGQHAGEALHDRAGCIRGNTADIAHRGLAGRRHLLLGGRKLYGELVFELLALGFRGRVELFARLVADGLRAGTCRSEFRL